jgi:hypothetical protein
MNDTSLTDRLGFLVEAGGKDEAAVIAEALRTGIEALYREALTEAFLLGRVSREKVLRELGPAQLADIELQRDALLRDVKWGLEVA